MGKIFTKNKTRKGKNLLIKVVVAHKIGRHILKLANEYETSLMYKLDCTNFCHNKMNSAN